MKVEEMALRSEIRQMLNEAGYNRETIKDLVKEVLNEQLDKAIIQAINETTDNFKHLVQGKVDSKIEKVLREEIRNSISDVLANRYFSKLKVDVRFPNWEEIISQEDSSFASQNYI